MVLYLLTHLEKMKFTLIAHAIIIHSIQIKVIQVFNNLLSNLNDIHNRFGKFEHKIRIESINEHTQ